MATTHTEVYRSFNGELAKRPVRWWPLFLSEFKVVTRKKLPLVLLYGPVAIGCIVTLVMVYLAYALESTVSEEAPKMDLATSMATAMVKSMFEVRMLIVEFFGSMSVFCLLASTWYGAGLICEDRRVNAHLLYFSRPLTRLDYFLGKFTAVAAFGAFAILVPGILICLMAVVNSEDYAFLSEQGDVIVNAVLYALLWIGTVSSIVLAISSVAPKKTFAMVGCLGFFLLTEVVVSVLGDIGNVESVEYLSLPRDLDLIANWMMATPGTEFTSEIRNAFLATGGYVSFALLVVARRLKRMELSI
ncbi:MAG: ABC-type transport system involved in multi-copper enzyme maturation permease subunit [Planctomycetota bacterium]|jgi:ABC-type transport system involved in multi-copper enzyme maturation permease subunit